MGFGKLIRHPGGVISHEFHNATHHHDFRHPAAVVAPVVAAVTGRHHTPGSRQIAPLAPAYKDVRVQAISGLDAATTAQKVKEVVATSAYLGEVANDIKEQLTASNNEIKALNRSADIFNGEQAQRLAHLTSLIEDVKRTEGDDAQVWAYMNQLLLAQRKAELE